MLFTSEKSPRDPAQNEVAPEETEDNSAREKKMKKSDSHPSNVERETKAKRSLTSETLLL